MKNNVIRRLGTWLQGRTGRFLLTQLAHTSVTVIVIAALFAGAARAGALGQVLAPVAQAPGSSFTTVNYQGRLADSGGSPINNTNPGIGMTFALYDVESGGSPVWVETHANVPISEGLFSVRLGSINALDTSHLTGDRWLGIQVGTDPEMAPREKLAAVPYAMQAGHAAEADTVPDGSITTEKLNITANLDFADYNLTNLGGIRVPFRVLTERSWEFRQYESGAGTITALKSMVDSKRFQFRTYDDQAVLGIHAVSSNGGYLDMYGHSIRNIGALVEANLQTPEELAADTIDRFSEGDILCWAEGQLERCTQAGDPLVQAVADTNGKPIIIGAEVIKVLGPVQRGDLLVASDVPGYAMVDNNPQPGAVIAQALEVLYGEQGLVRAMVRKF
jgi:hypothetical protein